MERRTVTPYSEEIEGLILPAPLAGHPALDFCNTFAGWDGVESGDYLRTYEHLAVFAAGAGLIDEGAIARLRRRARRTPSEAAAVLDRSRALRRSLYAVLTRPSSDRNRERVAAD